MASADEDLLNARRRINEALALGLFDTPAGAAGLTREVLQQTMNECTRHELACNREIENLSRQLDNMRGKAEGFASTRSIIFATFNALVHAQERANASIAEARAAAEKPTSEAADATTAETPDAPTAPSPEEPPKRRKRKVEVE